MKHTLSVLCLAALSAVPAAATPVHFAFDHMVFEHGSAVSGSVNIDLTSGQFTSADAQVTTASGQSFDLRTLENNQGSNWFGVYGAFGTELYVSLPVANMFGYDGGDICGRATAGCQLHTMLVSRGQANDWLTSGDLAHAPEPSSLWLLGSGLLAGAGALRSRKVSR